MLALLLALALGVSDADANHRQLRRQEEPAYRKRSIEISRELQMVQGDPWAGLYGYSNEMGFNTVRLAPRAGAAVGWRGCVGLQRLNHGAIRASGADWVEVAWAIDPGLDVDMYLGRRQPRLSARLLVIPWGREQYLVPEGRVMEFVNAANARDPMLMGAFWRRGVNERMGVHELEPGGPRVPVSLRNCLLETPITCLCLGARDRAELHSHDTPRICRELVVDSGSQPKLHVGMCLYAGSRSTVGEVVKVVGRYSLVEFRTLRTDADRAATGRGSELSTRPPMR